MNAPTEIITGCLRLDGKIVFSQGPSCTYYGCLVTSGVHEGQVAVTVSRLCCDDTYYGCLNGDGTFEVAVPKDCCATNCGDCCGRGHYAPESIQARITVTSSCPQMLVNLGEEGGWHKFYVFDFDALSGIYQCDYYQQCWWRKPDVSIGWQLYEAIKPCIEWDEHGHCIARGPWEMGELIDSGTATFPLNIFVYDNYQAVRVTFELWCANWWQSSYIGWDGCVSNGPGWTSIDMQEAMVCQDEGSTMVKGFEGMCELYELS